MDEARRFLIQRVIDNQVHNRGVCAWVKEIHESYVNANEIFRWLIQNHYTGNNFVTLVSSHNFNTFETCAMILGELYKEKGRKILLHRDFSS